MANLSDGPNWGQLVSQGRAKAHGIAWNEAELRAIHEGGMDPEDVRRGILTKDHLEHVNSTPVENRPIHYLKKIELLAKAKEMKIEVTNEEAATRGDLILAINAELSKQKEANPSGCEA